MAIKDFTKVIELNPGFSVPYVYRGFAYGKLGKWQEAMKDFDKGMEIYPEVVKDIKKAAESGDKCSQKFLTTKGIEW